MEEQKFYIIRIKVPQDSRYWTDTGYDDGEYNAAEYAFEHGSSVPTNISEVVSDVIGMRGEYVDWLEPDIDEIFAEEWAIYDDECIGELEMQDFGLDVIDVIVEQSTNVWEKIDGEWFQK